MSDSASKYRYRFERKFLTNQLNEHDLEQIVLSHSSAFQEIFQERQVNNIYFDTPSLRFFEDNVSGRADRLKVRIRWYGSDHSRLEHPRLELKIKKGLVGRKESYDLNDFKIPTKDSALFFGSLFESNDLPGHVRELLNKLEPVLINSYKRRYFLSFDRDFRFTVDWEMRYLDFNTRNDRAPLFYEDVQHRVLELKYAEQCDDQAIQVVNALPIRLTKSSKYVSGVYFIRPDLAV